MQQSVSSARKTGNEQWEITIKLLPLWTSET